MRCFSKHRRSARWHELKEETTRLIKESKQNYYAKAVDKLKTEGNNQVPYRILKELAEADRPKAWTVSAVRLDLMEEQLANVLADYFTKITDEFSSLNISTLSSTFPIPFDIILPHELAEKIKSEKKSVCSGR